MSEQDFLTIEDVAAILHAPVNSVRKWRQIGYGPRSAKIGKRVLYRASDVRAWVDQAFSA